MKEGCSWMISLPGIQVSFQKKISSIGTSITQEKEYATKSTMLFLPVFFFFYGLWIAR